MTCCLKNNRGNIMATKNLIANGLWIIRITKIILAKLSKRNCLLSGIRYLSTEKEAESLRIQQNQCFQSLNNNNMLNS